MEYTRKLPCGHVSLSFKSGTTLTTKCPECEKLYFIHINDHPTQETGTDLFWFEEIFDSSQPYKPDFKDTNPKSKAATYRLDLALVPGSLIAFAALGFQEGDAKYGGYNFRKQGVSVSTYIAAQLRHILRFQAGEWADPDTHVPHLASLLADTGIIADSFLQGNINDDRPPAQPKLLEFLKEAEDINKHLYENFNNPENKRVTESNKNDS